MTEDHVLVVGIDGVRYDTLREVATPHLDALEAAGFLRPLRVNDAGPTISGPSWSTIFTGVLTPDHGVVDNDFSSNRYAEHPDVVSLVRRQRPDVATWVGATWTPLVTNDSGGPLFADGGWSPASPPAHTCEAWLAVDAEMTSHAVAHLTSHAADGGSLVVAYLGSPDEVAHLRGVGHEYRDAIVAADAHLGRMLAAVAGREGEDWTVIVLTDHGHVDGGGHGGDTEVERTAWIAASGPGLATPVPRSLEQADVAAQMLAVLGVTPTSAAFIGRPFGFR
ncbi:alkaline phosphatase family protein [Occultella gossypii]|uniref:Alkaline phosphatase family protein n=1 Tax=Occultella gossypii TaxID=2800820 RepID=A0ABS7SH50_9MICO|nr:alkaline phosphatase family protein [Occultella gossypii]MBZ2199686.1 alkaline phosphatase family protein [Occultella gossypii]